MRTQTKCNTFLVNFSDYKDSDTNTEFMTTNNGNILNKIDSNGNQLLDYQAMWHDIARKHMQIPIVLKPEYASFANAVDLSEERADLATSWSHT